MPANPVFFTREGVDLPRSTLADWVGQAARLLTPLTDAIGRLAHARSKFHELWVNHQSTIDEQALKFLHTAV